ncbi:MAG: hypothetical protein U1C50_02310 [Patescibacteria group bacterium]|nr:hypothetical protein [Patescibacteria group bacterium]
MIAVGVVLVVGILVLKPVARPPVGVATPPPQPQADRPLVEDNDALAALQATISSLLKRLEILETDKNIPSPAKFQPEADQPVVEAQTVTKAVFPTQVLYLGAGSTTERNWTETGAQVQLNSANYPAGVNAVFEAGLSIIGGEAWARLKNKTTGAIISVSEVSHNNNAVVWKGSGAFKLHSGNNLYVVEIKSSSGETANLSGSRLQLSQ